MKRFSEQFKKKSDSVRMRASERADLRDRLVAYMEYHPLPQNMRVESSVAKTKTGTEIASEPFWTYTINAHFVRGFVGLFAVMLVVGVPFVAERSVPGDMLYPVKTNITEEVRAGLTLSPYAKVEWETQRLERRLAEARLLANEGKLTPEAEAQVAEAVKVHSDAAQYEIAQIRVEDEDEAAMAEIAFASALEVQSEVLEGHIAKAELKTPRQKGTSVVALASVVEEAADVADGVQEKTKPSYEKIRGRVEGETTRAYELFRSVQKDASESQILDIERRLADIERKITLASAEEPVTAVEFEEQDTQAVAATATEAEAKEEEELMTDNPAQSAADGLTVASEMATTAAALASTTGSSTPEVMPEVVTEETPKTEAENAPESMNANASPVLSTDDRVQVLRAALKDLRKLIAFMTDINVRENVTLEELVPVTLTDEERLAVAQDNYNEAKALREEIALYVDIPEAHIEKITTGTDRADDLLDATEVALTEGAVSEAERAATEALVVIKDIQTLLVDLPKTEPNVETESASTSAPVSDTVKNEDESEEAVNDEDAEGTETTETVE